jgi:hypothetical protein
MVVFLLETLCLNLEPYMMKSECGFCRLLQSLSSNQLCSTLHPLAGALAFNSSMRLQVETIIRARKEALFSAANKMHLFSYVASSLVRDSFDQVAASLCYLRSKVPPNRLDIELF